VIDQDVKNAVAAITQFVALIPLMDKISIMPCYEGDEGAGVALVLIRKYRTEKGREKAKEKLSEIVRGFHRFGMDVSITEDGDAIASITLPKDEDFKKSVKGIMKPLTRVLLSAIAEGIAGGGKNVKNKEGES